MQFRPSRVVTVTTPEELDSAFASADRLIVEGDDALLSYATTRASAGTGNAIQVELAQETLAVAAARRRLWMLPVLAALVAIGLLGAAVYVFVPFPEAAAPSQHHFHKLEHGQGLIGEPAEVGAEAPSEWAPFLWPAVSIVAILALFLVARQAIAGGRNVEISWKVSEKVSGRVVITKVRTPVRRQRAAPA